MGFVHGMRTLRALAAGTLTGAQLQYQLGDSVERASWQELLTSRSAVRFLQDSPNALAAVGASPLAVADIVRSAVASPQISADRFALEVLQAVPAGGGILAGERDTGMALEYMLRYETLGAATPNSDALLSLPTLSAVRGNAAALSAVLLNAKACNLLAMCGPYRSAILGARSLSAASEFQRFGRGVGVAGIGIAKLVAAYVGLLPATVAGPAELVDNATIRAGWLGSKALYLAVADIEPAVLVIGKTTAIGEVLNAGRVLDGFASNAALAAATSWADVMGSIPMLNAFTVSASALAFVGNCADAMAAAFASANARAVLFPLQAFWTAALRTGVGRFAIASNATAVAELATGAANTALMAATSLSVTFTFSVGGGGFGTRNIATTGGLVRRYLMPVPPDSNNPTISLSSNTIGAADTTLGVAAAWTTRILGSTLSNARAGLGGAPNQAATLSLEVLPYTIA